MVPCGGRGTTRGARGACSSARVAKQVVNNSESSESESMVVSTNLLETLNVCVALNPKNFSKNLKVKVKWFLGCPPKIVFFCDHLSWREGPPAELLGVVTPAPGLIRSLT